MPEISTLNAIINTNTTFFFVLGARLLYCPAPAVRVLVGGGCVVSTVSRFGCTWTCAQFEVEVRGRGLALFTGFRRQMKPNTTPTRNISLLCLFGLWQSGGGSDFRARVITAAPAPRKHQASRFRGKVRSAAERSARAHTGKRREEEKRAPVSPQDPKCA